jgi:cell division protein FtsN
VSSSDPIVAEGGLYAGDGIVDAAAPESAATSAAPKKRKTLFGDVFKTKDAEVDSEQPSEPPTPAVAAKKPVVAEQQTASGASGFMVQLASFRSRAEAQTEFARLKAKHSGTLGRYSPVISEATVGGATRYRLSVGSMDSRAQANAVCSSLFAGGERDCLVKSR